jgi:hypothetical protein
MYHLNTGITYPEPVWHGIAAIFVDKSVAKFSSLEKII